MDTSPLAVVIPKHLYTIFPTIENRAILLEDKRKGILAISCEHNDSYTVALYIMSRVADEQYEFGELLEIFMFSNFQDKEWFVQYLADMGPSRALMYINRKDHSQHPASRITSTNESEVERTKKFLGLDQMKSAGGPVTVLRSPKHERG